MIRKIYYSLILILSLGVTTACSDDDSPTDNSVKVPDAVMTSFQTKYPDIAPASVKWDLKGSYYVADYKTTANMREVEAWFSPDGTWRMTETDNGRDLFLLPTDINTAFNNSDYALWTIDDIEYYEYPDATNNFYLFEVEKTGETDTALYFSTAGTLIKTTPSANLDITPDTVI